MRRLAQSPATLLLLPLLVHAPALSGWLAFDPVFIVSGLAPGAWTTDGPLAGLPGWIDANAGVTTEALGRLAARDLLAGILPWWNPYAGVGMPLAAEGQVPVLFPPALLLALPHGLLWLRMLLMAAAGVFARALLRALGCGPWPALVGGALFELCGTFAWFAHGPILPIAFLPALLLGLERARRPGRGVLTSALALAASLLAGFPETAFVDGLLGLAWALLRLAQQPADARWHFAGRVAAAGALGCALAAPAVWPFLEAWPRADLGVHAGTLRAWWAPADFCLLLLPYAFGNVFASFMRLQHYADVWFRIGGTTDAVLLLLALAGGRRRAAQGGARLLLAGWLVGGGLLAAGFAPVFWLGQQVPLLRQINFHLYAAPSFSLALAMLAAFALDDLARGRSSRARLGAAAAIVAALAGAALLAARPVLATLLRELPGEAWFLGASLAAPMLAGCGLALLWRGSGRASLPAIAALVIAPAAVMAGLPLLAGTRPRAIDAASLAWLHAHAGLARVMSFGPLAPNYGSAFGIAELGTNTLPTPRTWVAHVRAQYDPAFGSVTFAPGAVPAPSAFAAMLPALQEDGVAYALTWPGQTLPLPRAWHGIAMDVWTLPHPAPYWQAIGCTLGPATRTRIEVACTAPATLLRRELADPGWTARAGETQLPIAVADGIFQRVSLPAGRTTIAFRYAPRGIAWAWTAAGLAAASLLAIAWRRRMRPTVSIVPQAVAAA